MSGVVEVVGSGVTYLKKGDRVAGYAMSIATGDINEGAYQEYSILQVNAAVKIPDSITYEEGATLPMAVATAGVAMYSRQGITRTPTSHQGIYLVWGAAASVGTSAVQIARKLGFTVFATASPHHHDYIKQLGASQVFDYKDPNVEQSIVNAAKAAGKTITHTFTAVSANGAAALAAKVLANFTKNGSVKLCTSLPWANDDKLPEGIEQTSTIAYSLGLDNKELGAWLFNEFLDDALQNGTYIPSPAVEKIEGGLSGLPKALDTWKAGVSGKKVMVSL